MTVWHLIVNITDNPFLSSLWKLQVLPLSMTLPLSLVTVVFFPDSFSHNYGTKLLVWSLPPWSHVKTVIFLDGILTSYCDMSPKHLFDKNMSSEECLFVTVGPKQCQCIKGFCIFTNPGDLFTDLQLHVSMNIHHCQFSTGVH